MRAAPPAGRCAEARSPRVHALRTLPLVSLLRALASGCGPAGEDDDATADDDAMPDDDSAPDGGTAPLDAGGDGYSSEGDRDDFSAALHPGAAEVCDGLDEDCDGSIDEGCAGMVTLELADAVPKEVGVPYDDRGATDNGSVSIWLGPPAAGMVEPDDADVLIQGGTGDDVFGFFMAASGDVDGDGVGDLLVGAIGLGGPGGVYVIPGPVGPGWGTGTRRGAGGPPARGMRGVPRLRGDNMMFLEHNVIGAYDVCT